MFFSCIQIIQFSLWVSSVCRSVSKPRASCTSEWVWPCVTCTVSCLKSEHDSHQTHHHTEKWSQKLNILTKTLWATCVCLHAHTASILCSIHQFNTWSYYLHNNSWLLLISAENFFWQNLKVFELFTRWSSKVVDVLRSSVMSDTWCMSFAVLYMYKWIPLRGLYLSR